MMKTSRCFTFAGVALAVLSAFSGLPDRRAFTGARGATPITDATLRGNATLPAGASLSASGNVVLAAGASFVVDAAATVSGLVRNLNNAALTGNVSLATGSLTLGPGVPLSVGGTLGVTGYTTLAGLSAGAINASTVATTGNVTVGGALGVSGATTLASLSAGAVNASTLATTGNATVGGALGVSGATTLASLTVNGTSRLKGAVTLDSTLNVGGQSTLQELYVNDLAVFYGSAAVFYSVSNFENAANFNWLATFNGNVSLNSTTTLQSGKSFYRYGNTYTYGFDAFYPGAYIALQSGAGIQAANGAQLQGIARAARYLIVEIPLGIHNRPATTAWAEWAGGKLKKITGYNYAYGFDRTEGHSAFFAPDGSFVAPVAGYYTISVGGSAAANNRSVSLWRNYYPANSTPDTVYQLASNGDDTSRGASVTWTGKLDAGDRVVIGADWNTSAAGANFPNTQFFVARLAMHPAEVWTDFELKISTNNFNGTAENALVHFYASAYGSGVSTHPNIGFTKAVYYTDNMGGTNHGEARKWRLQDQSRSIWQQRASEDSVIGGAIVVIPCTGVINPHNANLVASVQRVGDYLEEIWVPVALRWSIVDPRPSDQLPPPDNQPSPPPYWMGEM